MAAIFNSLVLFTLLFVQFAFSAFPLEFSPSHAPELAADSPESVNLAFPPANSPEQGDHAFAPENTPFGSPVSPSNSDMAPDYSPSSVHTPAISPVPSPSEASDVQHTGENAEGVEYDQNESDEMSSGKKAGIVLGVMASALLVVVGGLVYKKRRENIRRGEYSYAAREFI